MRSPVFTYCDVRERQEALAQAERDAYRAEQEKKRQEDAAEQERQAAIEQRRQDEIARRAAAAPRLYVEFWKADKSDRGQIGLEYGKAQSIVDQDRVGFNQETWNRTYACLTDINNSPPEFREEYRRIRAELGKV